MATKSALALELSEAARSRINLPLQWNIESAHIDGETIVVRELTDDRSDMEDE